MAEDIKKVPDEIKDDDLDFVAGGKYSAEEWAAMSVAEKRAAKNESAVKVFNGQREDCKYYN